MKAKESLFRKVLVATDFSEHAAAALGRALTLAEQTQAEITVVHVIADVADALNFFIGYQLGDFNNQL